jgi:hypothetical protein
LVFVARHLRYDLPDEIAAMLSDDRVWNHYVNFDKPIVLVGRYGSLMMKGDWFFRPSEIEAMEAKARQIENGGGVD